MVSEKNTIFSIQKLCEPVDAFIKLVREFEKKHRRSTETTANISREAGQDFLDEARVMIGTFDGFKSAVAQAVDRQTDKLQDQLENIKEKTEGYIKEIKDLKQQLKESEALAQRNEKLPDRIKAFLEAETVR